MIYVIMSDIDSSKWKGSMQYTVTQKVLKPLIKFSFYPLYPIFIASWRESKYVSLHSGVDLGPDGDH